MLVTSQIKLKSYGSCYTGGQGVVKKSFITSKGVKTGGGR